MFRHLTVEMILSWADAFREATGQWPTRRSGTIAGTVCETWKGVNRALRHGRLGLPGGSSLARLLAEYRGVRWARYGPPLSIEQILTWADDHRRITGKWPRLGSGRIDNSPFERWSSIDHALGRGRRGLPGGSSLARLLGECRGVRNLHTTPLLSEEQILVWIDAFHLKKGKWPKAKSGPIRDSGGETWLAIDTVLWRGIRGLPGGSSLARLKEEKRGVRNEKHLPDLRVPTILVWADAFFHRNGHYPAVLSGDIPEAPGETWSGVNSALEVGRRGLPGGSSLARLLAAELGVRNHMDLPPLRHEDILTWADDHHRQTGNWPVALSGAIPGTNETWLRVEEALRIGLRGLPTGSSLAKFLSANRDKRNLHGLPPLRVKDILAWADAYFQRHGKWPSKASGEIPEAPGETWSGVQTALQRGLRGLLLGGRSLAQLLEQRRAKRHPKHLPPLTEEQILLWADDYRKEHGVWPSNASGAIPNTNGETWLTVDKALRRGRRRLPGGSSVARLLEEHRKKRNGKHLPALALEDIRAWAEDHRKSTGSYPKKGDGDIPAAPGETWMAVDGALRDGRRGLPGGSSLAWFLREQEGVPREKSEA